MFSTILKPSFLHNAAHKIFYNMPNQHFLPCTQILTRKQGTCGQKQESAQGGGKCGSAANECGSGKSGEGGGGSCMKITYQPYKEYPIREHDEKNMTLKRPMSPHLDVYRMTMSALTSILQRATGIVLTMSAVALAGGTLFLPDGVNSMVQMVQYLSLPSPVVILGKFLLAFPFTFHYFNGIRFCLWNAGKMLDMQILQDHEGNTTVTFTIAWPDVKHRYEVASSSLVNTPSNSLVDSYDYDTEDADVF